MICSSSFIRMICSSPLSWKRFILLSLSLKKSSPKAPVVSRAPESMPNILGIIHLRGKMEGSSIELDLIRSLAPEEEAPVEEDELSFLTAFELELELCCCCCTAELLADEVSSIFISCSALFQKFCDSAII